MISVASAAYRAAEGEALARQNPVPPLANAALVEGDPIRVLQEASAFLGKTRKETVVPLQEE